MHKKINTQKNKPSSQLTDMKWFVIERNGMFSVISEEQLDAFSVLPEEQEKFFESRLDARLAYIEMVKQHIFEVERKLDLASE